MKVNNIQIQNISYTPAKTVKRNSSPAFKGTFAVNFWDAIARGGFASSFMLQDVIGTCLPRTYQSLNRNVDITGKKNYKAATETALREFITGPSMVAIPMLVLAGANKFSGTSNSVPMENIAPFSDQMKAVLQKMPVKSDGTCKPFEYAQKAKQAFYERAFALTLGEDVEQGISGTAKSLAKQMIEYDEAPKRNFIQQFLNKDIKKGTEVIKAKDQILEGMVTQFTDAKKVIDPTYEGLLTTDMRGLLKKPNKVTSLFKDFSNFAKDVQKTMMKHSPDGFLPKCNIDFNSFMDDFKYRRTGSKFLTNVLMVAATALFLSQIPKIYSRNKTNPETDAFRNESGEVVRAGK